MTQPEQVTRGEVRRALLVVGVLDEVDVAPTDAGVLLPARTGGPDVLLPWDAASAVLRDSPADSPDARSRLRTWLGLHRVVADLGAGAALALALASRPLALHAGGGVHPGSGWVRDRVPGGALDVGLGVVGLLPTAAGALPLWPDVAEAAGLVGVAGDAAWSRAAAHLAAMGELAVQRLHREQRTATPSGVGSRSRAGDGAGSRAGDGADSWADSWADRAPSATVLRPVGGCDVPTLLASPALRSWLAAGDGTGMRAVAAPARSCGWFDLARVDPAFVGAAWSATGVDERGLPRAVLVTADEVVLARGGRL